MSEFLHTISSEIKSHRRSYVFTLLMDAAIASYALGSPLTPTLEEGIKSVASNSAVPKDWEGFKPVLTRKMRDVAGEFNARKPDCSSAPGEYV